MPGPLVLVGGWSWDGVALRDMLHAQGDPRATVVPTAAMYEGANAAVDKVAVLLGADTYDVAPIAGRVHAMDGAQAASLARARVVVMPGESSIHLRSVMKDSQSWAAVDRAWVDGAVLVGIGGAASALVDPMLDDRGGAFSLGLGLVTGLAVVPHADRWGEDRMKRTARLVSRNVALVRVPDDAALIWRPHNGWTAYGDVRVTLDGCDVAVTALPSPA